MVTKLLQVPIILLNGPEKYIPNPKLSKSVVQLFISILQRWDTENWP